MLIYLRWCIALDMRVGSLRGSIGEGLLLWIILRPLCEPCSSVCTVRCRHGWLRLCTTAGPEATMSDPEGTESVGNIPSVSLSVQQTSFHQNKMWNKSYVQHWKYYGKRCISLTQWEVCFMIGGKFVGGKLWRHVKLFMLFEVICWTASANWSNHRLASK